MNIDELCVYNFVLKERHTHSGYLAMLSFLLMDSNPHYLAS